MSIQHIQTNKYSLNICGDLQVILILALQLGYMKFCCSFCERDSVFLLHIQLYLMKCFKDCRSNSSESVYSQHTLPMINKVKIKDAVLVGLQVKEIIRDSSLDNTEGAAWTEFTTLKGKRLCVNVFKNFSMLTTMRYTMS